MVGQCHTLNKYLPIGYSAVNFQVIYYWDIIIHPLNNWAMEEVFSFAAVLWDVTQHSHGGVLHDMTKNSYKGDYG